MDMDVTYVERVSELYNNGPLFVHPKDMETYCGVDLGDWEPTIGRRLMEGKDIKPMKEWDLEDMVGDTEYFRSEFPQLVPDMEAAREAYAKDDHIRTRKLLKRILRQLPERRDDDEYTQHRESFGETLDHVAPRDWMSTMSFEQTEKTATVTIKVYEDVEEKDLRIIFGIDRVIVQTDETIFANRFYEYIQRDESSWRLEPRINDYDDRTLVLTMPKEEPIEWPYLTFNGKIPPKVPPKTPPPPPEEPLKCSLEDISNRTLAILKGNYNPTKRELQRESDKGLPPLCPAEQLILQWKTEFKEEQEAKKKEAKLKREQQLQDQKHEQKRMQQEEQQQRQQQEQEQQQEQRDKAAAVQKKSTPPSVSPPPPPTAAKATKVVPKKTKGFIRIQIEDADEDEPPPLATTSSAPPSAPPSKKPDEVLKKPRKMKIEIEETD